MHQIPITYFARGFPFFNGADKTVDKHQLSKRTTTPFAPKRSLRIKVLVWGLAEIC